MAVQKMRVVVQKSRIFRPQIAASLYWASYIVCPKNDIRAGRPCWRLAISKILTDNLVQKLLVESGCRMSQRWDDFLLIALATGQPWRFAYHCRERRPRTPSTTTSAAGCGCAALCLQCARKSWVTHSASPSSRYRNTRKVPT